MSDSSHEMGEEAYFDKPRPGRGFDEDLLTEPLSALPVRPAIHFRGIDTVTDAVRAMQAEHRGCVLITEDGTQASKLCGIFTERDVLLRIMDRGRNPATLPLSEVMTESPEVLSIESTVAYALNKMCVGGFRHIPVVDANQHPAFVVAVRDVVEFLVDAFPREVMTLPGEANHTLHEREGA